MSQSAFAKPSSGPEFDSKWRLRVRLSARKRPQRSTNASRVSFYHNITNRHHLAYVLISPDRIRTNFDGNRSARGTITIPTTPDNIAHNHAPPIAKHGPHPHPYTASASYHRKSQSLDAATISAQIANHATKINKSHPHHHHHQQHHSTTTTNMHKER